MGGTICEVTEPLSSPATTGVKVGSLDHEAVTERTSLARRTGTANVGRLGLVAVLVAVFGVGAGIVFHNLSVGHALFGLTEYDDGAYFGAAMHFVNGQMPYRSFDLVQPPGIALITAPIALLVGPGDPRLGLGIARILTGVVVGLDALLVAWILRHRGLLAALAGGMLFAIYPPSYESDHTLMLEPYLVLFCLISVALAFSSGRLASDRRLFFAGLALGFAGTVKLFAVAVALAFGLVLVWRHRSALRPLVLGALIGFVVPCLPFFVAAPHAFIHDVFSSQLSRNTVAPSPFVARLAPLVGLTNVVSYKVLPTGANAPWTWLAGGLLALVSTLGTLIPAMMRRASALSIFAFVAAVLSFVMVLIPQQFYVHYDELAAAFFCLVLGGVVGSLTDLARMWPRATMAPTGSGRSRAPRFAAKPALGVVGALVILALTATVVHIESNYQAGKIARFGDPGRSLDRAIPKGSCVISDATSLLIIANRMNFSPGCPVMVDATGTWLAYAPLHPPQRNRREVMNPTLVTLWRHLFEHSNYAVFAGAKAFRVPFTPSLISWFNDHFQLVPGAAPITFIRRAHPVTNAPPIPGVVP